MSVFRRATDTETSTRRRVVASQREAVAVEEAPLEPLSQTQKVEVVTGVLSDERAPDESDVFVSGEYRTEPDLEAVATNVTLFVYGWSNVQPGPLSWVFPSLRAALQAVRAMRNAIAWSIVAGRDHLSLEEARAYGAVLVE